MASQQQQRSASVAGTREKTYFEQQREELIGEIAMVSEPAAT
jgi:DASH complex subunit DAD1